MKRSARMTLVKVFEKRILRYVEEIDDSYFIDDEKRQVLVDFVDGKKDFIYIVVNEKDEDSDKVVFIFRHKTENEEDLKQRIVSNIKEVDLPLQDCKIQLIGVAEGLHERNELLNVLGVNKKQICKDAGISVRKTRIDVLFTPAIDNKPIEIGVTRMNSIIFPEPNIYLNVKSGLDENKGNIKGYLFVVKLSELVDIYNRVGDELFSSNLRYGIGDQLSLENSMRRTLIEEPDMFWFYNNGVTIVTDKASNISLENPLKITFTDSWDDRKLDFSVINGAQTISTASRIFNDNSIDANKLSSAKDNAKVLLRVITANNVVLKRKITISLNRQKPIKAEDIAFQTPFVSKFNSYMGEREARKENFLYIIKRGEESYSNTIELPVFAQLVYSCFMHPTEARNSGPSKLYQDGNDSDDLKDKYFKNEFSVEESNEKLDELYFKYYHELIWAYKLYNKYNKTIREFSIEEGRSILANNRWAFVSYILLCMQGQNYDRCTEYEVDYTNFKESNEPIVNIKKYMEAFVSLVNAAFSDKVDGYTVNASKTGEFWDKLCGATRVEIFKNLFVEEPSSTQKNNEEKDNFIKQLIEMKFINENGKYTLEVDCARFRTLHIIIKGDNSFDISAELFNQYYGSTDMTEDEIADAYGELIDEVNVAFTDKMGIEPCIEDNLASLQGDENPFCDVSYNNIPFAIEFVKSFIKLMKEI